MEVDIIPTGLIHPYREIDCPCCGSKASELFVEGRKLDTYQFYSWLEGFDRLNYVQCLRCSLIYSNPRLAYTDSTLEQIAPAHAVRRLQKEVGIQEQLRNRKTRKLEQIVRFAGDKRGRFLEIGCGSGLGLEAAIAKGFDAVGTELYSGFIEACRLKGLQVFPGTVEGISFPDASFAVVFLDDVLEHLDHPFAYLDEIVRVLQPGGILYINTWVIDDPTSVEDAFGLQWRQDMNLDLTAHTTIFPTPLLLDQLKSRGLVPQLEYGNWRAGEGTEAHAVQFCDFLARKIS